MPIYAFECTDCGHNFERLQRLSDADPTRCPECDVEAIRRQLTAPQFRLAGGGWYETDFKKDGDKKRNLAGDAGEPKSGASGSSGNKPGESTPADTAKSGDTKPSSGSADTGKQPAASPAKADSAGTPPAKPAAAGT